MAQWLQAQLNTATQLLETVDRTISKTVIGGIAGGGAVQRRANRPPAILPATTLCNSTPHAMHVTPHAMQHLMPCMRHGAM